MTEAPDCEVCAAPSSAHPPNSSPGHQGRRSFTTSQLIHSNRRTFTGQTIRSLLPCLVLLTHGPQRFHTRPSNPPRWIKAPWIASARSDISKNEDPALKIGFASALKATGFPLPEGLQDRTLDVCEEQVSEPVFAEASGLGEVQANPRLRAFAARSTSVLRN